MTMEVVSENKSHGGRQLVVRHASHATSTDMTFSIFLPPFLFILNGWFINETMISQGWWTGSPGWWFWGGLTALVVRGASERRRARLSPSARREFAELRGLAAASEAAAERSSSTSPGSSAWTWPCSSARCGHG